MAYTKLNKRAIQRDGILRTFLEEKPRYTKTVTIAPSQRLWEKFVKHVKRNVGSKKVSRMVNYLVHTYLEEAEPQDIPDYSQEDTITVTLSVDHEIWGKFMSRLREMYSKHKLQSEIINIILTDYLGDE